LSWEQKETDHSHELIYNKTVQPLLGAAEAVRESTQADFKFDILNKRSMELVEEKDGWEACWFVLEGSATKKEAQLLTVIAEMGASFPAGGGPSPPPGMAADLISVRMDNLELSIMEASQVLCQLDGQVEDFEQKMEQSVAACCVETKG
jgi:hypothetical protein